MVGFEEKTYLEMREDYLSQVQQQLSKHFTALEIFESMAELREHIEELAIEGIALGLEPGVAMGAALHRFGPPNRLGALLANSESRNQAAALPNITINLPKSLVLTVSVATASLGVFLSSLVFSIGQTSWIAELPMKIYFGVVLGSALVISISSWVFKRVNRVPFAIWTSTGFNVILGLTFYPFLANLGYPAMLFKVVIGLTAASFLFAYATWDLAQLLRLRFPFEGALVRMSRRPSWNMAIRAIIS